MRVRNPRTRFPVHRVRARKQTTRGGWGQVSLTAASWCAPQPPLHNERNTQEEVRNKASKVKRGTTLQWLLVQLLLWYHTTFSSFKPAVFALECGFSLSNGDQRAHQGASQHSTRNRD